jgi:hypothetical protein
MVLDVTVWKASCTHTMEVMMIRAVIHIQPVVVLPKRSSLSFSKRYRKNRQPMILQKMKIT